MSDGHSSDEESTQTGFVDRLQKLDEDAWRELLRKYKPLVFRWCHKYPLTGDQVHEIFLEVMLGAVRSIHSFRRENAGDKFRAWLYTLTKFKAVDYYRRFGQDPDARGGSSALAILQQHAAKQPPSESGGATSRSKPRDPTIENAKANFNEKTWRAYEEYALHNRPAKDVAADLGVSASFVYTAKSRVLSVIRELKKNGKDKTDGRETEPSVDDDA